MAAMDPTSLTDEQLEHVLDTLWAAWNYCKTTNNPRRQRELEQSIEIAEKEQARRRQHLDQPPAKEAQHG